MKKVIKILIISYLAIFVLSANIYADNTKDCETGTKDIFEKYQCRIEKVCKSYNENKKIFNPEKYKKAKEYENSDISNFFSVTLINQVPIKKAISIYKENMNSIYKCAMIGIQKKSILNIKNDLKLDKTGDLNKNLDSKINNLVNRLDMTAKSAKCLIDDKNNSLNKLNILKQTTQITCEYAYYMSYLKEYYDDTEVVGFPKNGSGTIAGTGYISTGSITNVVFAKELAGIQNNLDLELEHSFKIFSISFNAYNEYENNYPIHFLLELIKEDYTIFRDKLYAVLNPINQVVYKISNAMKKN
ncbi:MAG: hypothetical protein PHE25_01945 [Candidatus Gracilibacteria bacterium]|nr:hypothetical protein [Candidatus Gracilibacteria bacterium]